MKKQFPYIILFMVLVALLGCNRAKVSNEAPSCVQNKIKQIRADKVRNPPTEVWEWSFDGTKFYYITADCCDQMNELYNSNCEVICHPDGGITGGGDGKCPDFTKGTLTKKLIWKDGRK